MFNPNDTKWDDKLDFAGGLPDGEHLTFISDADIGTSNSGTEFVELEFTCHDPTSAHRNKSQRFEKFWTSEKALPRLVRLCRAAGVTKPFDLRDPSAVQDALLDRILRVTIKSKKDTYQGVTRMRSEVHTAAPMKGTDRETLLAEYGDTMLPPMEGGPDQHDPADYTNPPPSADGDAAAAGSPEDVPF